MILVSVGTQLPFDRLIRAVDLWAMSNERTDVIAQIGPSTYQPQHIDSFKFMESGRFRELEAQSDFLVAHAGTGSILAAFDLGKPIIVMPRDPLRGEHRSDHQKATARRLCNTRGLYIADDEAALSKLLDESHLLNPPAGTRGSAQDVVFVRRLRAFIEDISGE